MYPVNIAEAQPGLVLAKAVVGPGGAVLCPAGFELTEAAIARLASAGTASVVVQGETEDTGELRKRIEALESRFQGIHDPILLQVKAAAEGRLKAFLQERSGAE